jgi:serine/threonine protein phosphatase PrpC
MPRQREVGIVGRPHPVERLSGDDAVFHRRGAWLELAVADGLGHGPEARRAASTAVHLARDDATGDLDALLLRAHTSLQETRGAVMAVASLPPDRGEVAVASVGNVSITRFGPRELHRFGGSSFTLGRRGRTPKVWTETVPITPWEALVLFTDGVSSKADIQANPELLRQHPVVLAHQLLLRFGVDSDDALVLVAR